MDSSDDSQDINSPVKKYCLRNSVKSKSSKTKKRKVKITLPPKSNKKSKPIRFTKDGYIDDGWIDNDGGDWVEPENNNYFEVDSEPIQDDIVKNLVNDDIDYNTARSVVSNAFKGTGANLIERYSDTKPSDNWKLGVSQNIIDIIEPQLQSVRQTIKDEIPTIVKIYNSNITTSDKTKCTKLYDQLQNIEPYTQEYDNKVSEINNILRKSNKYTKEEIEWLESESNRLKQLAKPSDDLEDRILKLDAHDNIKAVIYGQYLEMLSHEVGSQQYNSIREEIEWGVKLPHNKAHTTIDLNGMTREQLNKYYQNFIKMMDNELYGMKDIKMKMLHIINDRRKSNNACGRNIAIVGEPGTGKTAIGKAFAKVMGLPFEKVSLGGLDDASVLKGSDRVWNSSSPSIVLQILSRVQSSSGVVMFDELDKLGETPKGREVQYALLHITDYVHNKEFRDNYLNKFPHDFSKIIFVFCANKIETLDSALLSRLDLIYTRAYDNDEKKIILTDYVLPRALVGVGLSSDQIKLDTKVVNKLVLLSKDDPGVRTIEKIIKELVGRVNMYNSVVLDDGTTGDLDLGYTIPNFKLPLTINTKLLNSIM